MRSSGRSQSEEETAGTIFPTVLVLTKSDLLDDPRGRKKLQVRFFRQSLSFLSAIFWTIPEIERNYKYKFYNDNDILYGTYIQ